MMRSKRFEPIQEIAASAADDLSRAMADTARRVGELEQQLAQLRGYREDYVREGTAAHGPMDAVKLQNYRSFIDRLGAAIAQHTQVLETARVEYERRRALWSAKRVEAQSLGRAVERFRGEERRAEERREQHEGDEAAMRVAAAAFAERSRGGA